MTLLEANFYLILLIFSRDAALKYFQPHENRASNDGECKHNASENDG